LIKSVAAKFQKENAKDLPSLDNETATQAKETRDTEEAVDTLQEANTLACNNSFKTAKTIPERNNEKSIPWWTQEFAIKRKRLTALRRRYQRTHTTEVREIRKKTYHEEKSRYQAAIKREK